MLGLAFLFTQVGDAAGAEPSSPVTSVAGDPWLVSEAPEPETPPPPPPPPEVQPPESEPPMPVPPEPAPAPSEPPQPVPPEPAPAPSEPPLPVPPEPVPTEPPDAEPAPAPSEPPQPEPAPAPSEPPQPEPAPAPSEPLEPDDEQVDPPPATPDDVPNADPGDPGDPGGLSEEPSPAPQSARSPGPAHIAPDPDDLRQPVAFAPKPAASTPGEAKHPPTDRGSSGPMTARAPVALARDQPAGSRIDGDRCDLGGIEGCADVVSASAASVIVIASPRVPTTVNVAVEFGKAGHGWAGAIVFNLWLRRQLRERRMSQRRLALLSGVSHSTISRLLAGDRTPSLDTAARLARALRVPNEEIGAELGFVAGPPPLPTQRVEAALRGDSDLDDTDVRELMDEYITRRRRLRLKAVDSTTTVRRPPVAPPPDRPA